MKKKKRANTAYASYGRRYFWLGFIILLVFSFLALYVPLGVNMTGYQVYEGDVTNIYCGDKICAPQERATCPSDCGGAAVEGNQGWVPDVFNFWTPTGGEGSFIRYLVFMLVFMIVYWTINGLLTPEEETGRSKWLIVFYILFSVIVAYLSINFILTDEIIALMVPYSALGAMFIVVIPFLVVLLFNAKLVSSLYLTLPRVLIQRVIWAVYAAFVVYYLLTLGMAANQAISWIIAGIAVFAFLCFLFNDKFIKYVRRLKKSVREANKRAEMHELKLRAVDQTHSQMFRRVQRDLEKNRKTKKQLERDIESYLHDEVQRFD